MRQDDHERSHRRETEMVLETYAAAWKEGDLVGMFAAYADDVVFHYFGTHQYAGNHLGKDAAVAAMVAIATRVRRTLLEIEDVLVGDAHRGAILAVERLERDGEAVVIRRALHYRVAAGLIAECWLYDEDQRLIDRLLA